MKIFKTKKDGKAADYCGNINDAAQLPQSPACFTFMRQFHTNTLASRNK